MSQLKILPQAAVIWGIDIASETAARLSEWAVQQPIIFSAPALEGVSKRVLAPYILDSVGTVSDLPAHAPEKEIKEALKKCIDLGAQSIVAHGGGSVLDAAKAVSYMHHQQTGRYLPIAAFPTTLSGSEFSHYFGITEERNGARFKRSYAVTETVPTVVVLDPLMLIDTPRVLLLSSAIKGLDHAVEGMRNITVENPHAIMAANGVRRFLSVLARWPRAVETRAAIVSGTVTMDDLLQLQLAAWHCYFAPASVIYGLSHRIGHILGGTFGLPHSVTSCITLAPVIRDCHPFYEGRLRIFADDNASGEAAAGYLADRIAALVRTLDLPDRIGAFEITRDALPQIASLLKSNYPNEVADLGENADVRLDRLLESLW